MLSVYSGSRDFFIIFSFTAKEGCFCFEYCNFISGYNYSFCLKKKNRHKTQRKAKFYLNNWRSVFYMQGGLKQALA